MVGVLWSNRKLEFSFSRLLEIQPLARFSRNSIYYTKRGSLSGKKIDVVLQPLNRASSPKLRSVWKRLKGSDCTFIGVVWAHKDILFKSDELSICIPCRKCENRFEPNASYESDSVESYVLAYTCPWKSARWSGIERRGPARSRGKISHAPKGPPPLEATFTNAFSYTRYRLLSRSLYLSCLFINGELEPPRWVNSTTKVASTRQRCSGKMGIRVIANRVINDYVTTYLIASRRWYRTEVTIRTSLLTL